MNNFNLSTADNQSFIILCDQLQRGEKIEADPDGRENVFKVLTAIMGGDNEKALNALLDCGFPLNYNQSHGFYSDIASVAVLHSAVGCLDVLHDRGVNFRSKECTVGGANYFLYAIAHTRHSLIRYFGDYFSSGDEKNKEDQYNLNSQNAQHKNALHLMLDNPHFDQEVIEYVLGLPFHESAYYATDCYEESPIVIAVCAKKDWACEGAQNLRRNKI